MTQDEIIGMAKENGIAAFNGVHIVFELSQLKAFAKLVDAKATAKEREACAIACETDGRDLAGLYYAGVIRARGDTE